MEARVGINVQQIQATARCAIYVRSASSTREGPHPLAVQLRVCEDYSAQKKWETVGVYKDHDFSSSSPFSYLGLDGMMAAAKRGTFDVLLVEDLCRLSRNASRAYALLKELEALGVAVHTVGGVISGLEMMIGSTLIARSTRERVKSGFLRQNCKLRPKRSETVHGEIAS